MRCPSPSRSRRAHPPSAPSNRGGQRGPNRNQARRRNTSAAPHPPAASRPPAEKEPGPTITLRGLGLFIVILVAFIVLAPTLRHTVEQQEQLRRIDADVAAAQDRTAELEFMLEQWQDDTFVQAQARNRLGYVMPGERTYRVTDPETITGGGPTDVEEPRLPSSSDTPWYIGLWDSVTVAGQSSAEDAAEDAADEPEE